MDITTIGLLQPTAAKQRRYLLKSFVTALVLGIVIFLPFVVKDKGLFILYGDFNVQQIPFYQLAHKAVRSGNIFWNWNTDLGANFFASYTFYLLFSPFFWLTLLFPTAATPYLMAPLLVLKTACAAASAYCFLERFVKNRYYAYFGSLLYAFSGWMTINIFFNHFHEVAIFFPLLLLGVEKLVTEDKKVFFGLMVAVNAMVNYWFFAGEVVFVVIYVIVRCSIGGWGMTPRKFIRLAVEAVLGLLLSAVVVLPSILALMGNPRADTDRLQMGIGFWIYWHNSSKYGDYPQRLAGILSSMFFPPELNARPNIFDKHGAQWASLSAWLPMVGISGVLAYFHQTRKKTWLKRMLLLCLFFALIPGFNSMFVLLNNSYYARWFYMPVLLMALATIIALERSRESQSSILMGIKWAVIPAFIVTVAVTLTPDKKGGEWVFGFAKDPPLVWLWFAFVALGFVVFGVLVYYYQNHIKFQKWLTMGLCAIIASFGIVYFGTGQGIYNRSADIREYALGKQGSFDLPNDTFYRSDIYDDMDNLLMYWGYPTIQTFHSVVPVSIMEFYPEVGVKRAEGSRPETEYYALRALLSVRYLWIRTDKDEQSPMPGYQLASTQNGYYIYENEAYIPMGFAYDYWLSEEAFKSSTLAKKQKGNLLLRALVLPPEAEKQAAEYSMQPLPEQELAHLGLQDYFADVAQRNMETVDDFIINKYGFTAHSKFAEPRMVFFSVPYENGWSATVNGKPVAVTKANVGFMAVPVPAGVAEIRFTYETPGLRLGLYITAGTALVFLCYGVVVHLQRKKRGNTQAQLEEDYWLYAHTYSWEEYLKKCRRAGSLLIVTDPSPKVRELNFEEKE